MSPAANANSKRPVLAANLAALTKVGRSGCTLAIVEPLTERRTNLPESLDPARLAAQCQSSTVGQDCILGGRAAEEAPALEGVLVLHDPLAKIVALLPAGALKAATGVEPVRAVVGRVRPQLGTAIAARPCLREEGINDPVPDPSTPAVWRDEDQRDVAETRHGRSRSVVREPLRPKRHPHDLASVIGNDQEGIWFARVPTHPLFVGGRNGLATAPRPIRDPPDRDRRLNVGGGANPDYYVAHHPPNFDTHTS